MSCREETVKGAHQWGHPEGDNHPGLARVITDAPFRNMRPQWTVWKRKKNNVQENSLIMRKEVFYVLMLLALITVLGLASGSPAHPALCSVSSILPSLRPVCSIPPLSTKPRNHLNHQPCLTLAVSVLSVQNTPRFIIP